MCVSLFYMSCVVLFLNLIHLYLFVILCVWICNAIKIGYSQIQYAVFIYRNKYWQYYWKMMIFPIVVEFFVKIDGGVIVIVVEFSKLLPFLLQFPLSKKILRKLPFSHNANRFLYDQNVFLFCNFPKSYSFMLYSISILVLELEYILLTKNYSRKDKEYSNQNFWRYQWWLIFLIKAYQYN